VSFPSIVDLVSEKEPTEREFPLKEFLHERVLEANHLIVLVCVEEL
jgi:hypothetical protein